MGLEGGLELPLNILVLPRHVRPVEVEVLRKLILEPHSSGADEYSDRGSNKDTGPQRGVDANSEKSGQHHEDDTLQCLLLSSLTSFSGNARRKYFLIFSSRVPLIQCTFPISLFRAHQSRYPVYWDPIPTRDRHIGRLVGGT